ncbi:MAG: hypothetical protein K8L91_00635 [Anaerolineae bacterium]|nr:hypothetical protein [Anaerolineae bacterium]
MTEPILKQLLDSVNLDYTLRFDESGRLYAGFQYEIEPDVTCAFTASVRAHMLQFRAHQILEVPILESDLWKVNELNQRWGRGAIYYNGEAHCYEAHAGLYIGNDTVLPAEVFEVLHNLRAIVWRLRRYPACLMQSMVSPYSFDRFFQAEYENLFDTGVTLAAVKETLHEMDYAFIQLESVLAQHFVEDDGNEFFVEFFTIGNRRLVIRARHRDDQTTQADSHVLAQLHELNSQFVAGSFVLQPASGRVFYWAALPLTLEQIHPALLDWMIDLGATAMRAANEIS